MVLPDQAKRGVAGFERSTRPTKRTAGGPASGGEASPVTGASGEAGIEDAASRGDAASAPEAGTATSGPPPAGWVDGPTDTAASGAVGTEGGVAGCLAGSPPHCARTRRSGT